MSHRLTTICNSILGSMLMSFLVFLGFYILILLPPIFLGIALSVGVFIAGFILVHSEINLSPKNSTWRSVVGVMIAISPILVAFLNLILTPDKYTAY